MGKKAIVFSHKREKTAENKEDYYELLFRRSGGLGLELGFLISERLKSMDSEETPQSVPDRLLVFHVEPLIYKVIQGFYVDLRQGQTDTSPGGFVRQRRVHLWYNYGIWQYT